MKEKVNQSEDLNDKKNLPGKKRRTGVAGLKIGLLILAVSFIFAGIVFGYYFGYNVFAEQGGGGTGVESEIVVEEGDSLSQIANELYNAGLIEDRLIFMFRARFYEYKIVPGTYILNDSMTYDEIFIQLEGGGF